MYLLTHWDVFCQLILDPLLVVFASCPVPLFAGTYGIGQIPPFRDCITSQNLNWEVSPPERCSEFRTFNIKHFPLV